MHVAIEASDRNVARSKWKSTFWELPGSLEESRHGERGHERNSFGWLYLSWPLGRVVRSFGTGASTARADAAPVRGVYQRLLRGFKRCPLTTP